MPLAYPCFHSGFFITCKQPYLYRGQQFIISLQLAFIECAEARDVIFGCCGFPHFSFFWILTVPKVRRFELLRILLPFRQKGKKVFSADNESVCLFACVGAFYQPAFQQIQGCAFAHVTQFAKLFFADRFRQFRKQFNIIFRFYSAPLTIYLPIVILSCRSGFFLPVFLHKCEKKARFGKKSVFFDLLNLILILFLFSAVRGRDAYTSTFFAETNCGNMR